MVDVQTVLTYLTLISIPVGIFYYIMTLRNAQKTRQTQLLMGLYETYRSPEFAHAWGEVMEQEYTDFDDYWEKYGTHVNREAWSNWQSVARAFHGMGVLLKRGLVDIDLVEELLVNIVLISWNKMGPILLGFREYTRSSDSPFGGLGSSKRYPQMSGFEYLYNELKKRDK